MDLSRNLTPSTVTITEAVKRLEQCSRKLILVVDADGRLIGTVTDGDVRRAILRMVPMDSPITTIMNASPVVMRPNDDYAKIAAEMRARLIQLLPVLDAAGRVVNLENLEELARDGLRPNLVVIMAGGRGARLAPLTEQCPKPMLHVGGKPILETLIERLRSQGFHRFCISVNYMAHMVSDHFGDGSNWDAEITYVHEDEPRGTAGALSMVGAPTDAPVLVLNGDLLTQLDFQQLLVFHKEHEAMATVGLRDYEFQVPFGAVDVEGVDVTRIREKPVFRCFVAAGIYCFEPAVFDLVPRSGRLDMPDLLNSILEGGHSVRSFPIHEYWLDIGRRPDFDLAQSDYSRLFAETRQ